jgi:hypothetical protein
MKIALIDRDAALARAWREAFEDLELLILELGFAAGRAKM